ncbi:unnamed protein product, partial [marine sediment metagenome]
LFAAMTSLGAAAECIMFVQLEFTFIELADKDYIELIQSMLPANL